MASRNVKVKVPLGMIDLYEKSIIESRQLKAKGIKIPLLDIMINKAKKEKCKDDIIEQVSRWRL